MIAPKYMQSSSIFDYEIDFCDKPLTSDSDQSLTPLTVSGQCQ
jgi:hypothetical protein